MNASESFLPDDRILLLQMEQGNEVAFNRLFQKYWNQVYSEAFKRLKNSDDAKDIVQEIFTYLWVNRQSLNIKNLPAYLHIAVRNRVLKLLAKQKTGHSFFNMLNGIPQQYVLADANLLWKEFFSAYEALLQSLPPKRQVIFRMRYQDGLSTKVIAGQLGIKRKTIQNQLGKTIDTLKISLLKILFVHFILFPWYI
ncbi:MAG: sigma-70 family RNA polymerase sigma factor [Chitinophagaceae bacterium]|nr:sigma-70 family RNA polymerase sigma factor [Chitinophagaceae bacterium]